MQENRWTAAPWARTQEGASRVEAHAGLDTALAIAQGIPGRQESRECAGRRDLVAGGWTPLAP